MKNLLSTLSLVFLFSFTNAQEETENIRVKEMGITFASLNNFGLSFRIGNPKSVWRFNSAFISGTQSDILGSIDEANGYSRNLGLGLQIGREFRKKIDKNFELRSGTDLHFRFNRRENKSPSVILSPAGRMFKRDNLSFGLNLVLGMNYIIKEHFVLGVEVQPFISYNELKSKDENTYFNGTNYVTEEFSDNTKSISFGMDNNSALLSIAYRY
ncbi:MAG: hypothetical protein JKY48_02975 [Flavobacteriales bacterium]|nr:hypothetical protein [Flavobacteriales bacterium]